MIACLCICDNDLIFHFTGSIIGINEISKLEKFVTLDNYKKIKLLQISSKGTLQYKFDDDATNFVRCDTTDILFNIHVPLINKKLFPQEKCKVSTEEDKTLKEYIVSFNSNPTKSMTLNEIGEYIRNTNNTDMKIYDPITKKTYHNFPKNLNKYTEWNNSEDILPLDKYLTYKYKMIMYYPKDLNKPFELHSVEAMEKEMKRFNNYNLRNVFNNYCLEVETEVWEFIKKNNITQLQQVLIIKNNKICGKFNHIGYFYGEEMYASNDFLNPVYQKIFNMCLDYMNNIT